LSVDLILELVVNVMEQPLDVIDIWEICMKQVEKLLLGRGQLVACQNLDEITEIVLALEGDPPYLIR
jgi:hypothetical protein